MRLTTKARDKYIEVLNEEGIEDWTIRAPRTSS
jgi:hypothetical protein